MNTPKNEHELDTLLRWLSQGLSKKKISKKSGIKKTTLSNRLKRLEDLGCIKRKGKYVVEVLLNKLPSSYKHPKVTKNQINKKLNKRGHAHNFKVHFARKVCLWELPKVKQDKKLKILKELEFGSLKFVKDGFTIWINKHTLTIYSNNSYYSGNALHSKFHALRNVATLIENMILKYGFPKVYGIEIFREHYGLIFNKFAKWINSQGKKMYVQDRKGKSILWVDKSRKDDVGLDEFEGEDPMKINSADNYFQSHEETGWKNDAHAVERNKKEIGKQKEVIGKSMKVLEGYAEQIALHLKVEQNQLIVQQEQLRTARENTKTQKDIQKLLKEFTHTK